MTAVAVERTGDALLSGDVLVHLNAQLESARRLLAIVLEQAEAIRERAVPRVVRLAGALQVEMHRREVIELERVKLMDRASHLLGLSPGEVTISMLTSVMDDDAADVTRERTAELRTMLTQIQSLHETNRALMQQELAFLDHLLRLAGGTGSYDSAGDHVSARRTRALARRPLFDMEA